MFINAKGDERGVLQIEFAFRIIIMRQTVSKKFINLFHFSLVIRGVICVYELYESI